MVNESLLVVLSWHTEGDPSPIPEWNFTAQQKTLVLVYNWLKNVIWYALNYIPEPTKQTKLMFSAILLSFGRGSGWDELLYVITELPASFLRPVPRFDPLCMEHAMSDLLWDWTGLDSQKRQK